MRYTKPKRNKVVNMLCDKGELSYKEIGEMFYISRQRVEQIWKRSPIYRKRGRSPVDNSGVDTNSGKIIIKEIVAQPEGNLEIKLIK